MDLSPYNHCRCDKKLCQYGRAFNIIALGFTILLISGLAQANHHHPQPSEPQVIKTPSVQPAVISRSQ